MMCFFVFSEIIAASSKKYLSKFMQTKCCVKKQSNTVSANTMEEPTRNTATKLVKRVVGRNRKNASVIPEHIVDNVSLNEAISVLPKNYNFEIHKTIWKVLAGEVELVALQFPEGLLMYSCIISDILSRFTGSKVIILGDVTYGACCIDDFSAHKLGATLLIHYGHSCLVPVNVTRIKVLYVFVEIQFDSSHLISTIKQNFAIHAKLALLGTIQFTNVVHSAAQELKADFPNIIIPQVKPLSPGETLGCTSPIFSDCDAFVFVADGRFHLEAAMIQNPSVRAFRYDPYSKVLSSEGYDTRMMTDFRWSSIERARNCRSFGVILGTLGRQGNSVLFKRIADLLQRNGKVVVKFLMAEILPQKLALIKEIDAWVQVACPRLSIDWGGGFDKPMLTSYEVEVAFGDSEWLVASGGAYPMDYYSGSGGSWTNYQNKTEPDVQS